MGLDTSAFDVIAGNLAGVREQIAGAAARASRRADDIRLIGVTKYVGLPAVQALIAAGCRDLGESRPQELWQKAAELVALTPARSQKEREIAAWHLIGHLQRNKVRRTLPLVSWIHSADSLRLLEEINREAASLGLRPSVLLEVNISGDATKHGFRADELEPLLPRLADLPSVSVRGLMCMAALEGDLDVARRNFANLRELRDRLRRVAPPNVLLDELSMGMSGDFEVAVEEGATMVRIGSALFQGVA
jgi:pyridoxal phosphate enzyme (YggS family)